MESETPKKATKKILSVEVPSVEKPNLSHRRVGRILAMQCLYAYEINPDSMIEQLLEFSWNSKAKKRSREFARQLVLLWVEHREEVEKTLLSMDLKWDFSRISATNKAILRLSLCELLYSDVDRKVIISEALELAKYMGEKEDYRFINGLLEQIKCR